MKIEKLYLTDFPFEVKHLEVTIRQKINEIIHIINEHLESCDDCVYCGQNPRGNYQ